MTSPIFDAEPAGSQPKAESFVDWFHINSRWITIGASAAAVAIFAYWFVQRTSLNETINSDKQLLVAKQSLNSGNSALAESDLKKVSDKYATKPAGIEAGMLLAQLRMDKGDYQAAAAGLRSLTSRVTKGPNAAPLHGLLGDAEAQLGKPADAAAEYQLAAGLTSMPNEKSFFLSKSARAYMTAGKPGEARKLFEGLASQSENDAIAAEARVRLGELSMGAKM